MNTRTRHQSEAGWLKDYRARRHAWSVAARQRSEERGELLAALNRLHRPGMDAADLDAVRAIRQRIAELDADTARAVTV